MSLYGANGEQLKRRAVELRDPHGQQERLERNKRIVEAWLREVAGAGTPGHGDHNWAVPPVRCLRQAEVDDLRARGIAVYTAPGMIVLADLTGPYPRVRQRRPLAERYIELVPEAGSC